MEAVFNLIEQVMFTELIGEITFYSILSTVLKFVFVIIVLSFIYSVVRMISMDLRANLDNKPIKADYLKLLNEPGQFEFPIRNEYYLTDNTTIGRADDNSIVIKDRQMSKHQARIVKNNGIYFIDDLGSTNPTMVNGVVISQPTQLKSLDVLNVGGVDFAFINGDSDEKQYF